MSSVKYITGATISGRDSDLNWFVRYVTNNPMNGPFTRHNLKDVSPSIDFTGEIWTRLTQHEKIHLLPPASPFFPECYEDSIISKIHHACLVEISKVQNTLTMSLHSPVVKYLKSHFKSRVSVFHDASMVYVTEKGRFPSFKFFKYENNGKPIRITDWLILYRDAWQDIIRMKNNREIIITGFGAADEYQTAYFVPASITDAKRERLLATLSRGRIKPKP